MKLTRRELGGAAMAGVLKAQAPTPQASALEKESQAALEAVRRNGETLAKHVVPMDAEPAFQFRA
jgi:hypothetical protein